MALGVCILSEIPGEGDEIERYIVNTAADHYLITDLLGGKMRRGGFGPPLQWGPQWDCKNKA